MLVKILAVLKGQNAECVKDYYINPAYIISASFSEDSLLQIGMVDETKYVIHDPSWIESSAKDSSEFKTLFERFRDITQKWRDEEYDIWVDQHFAEMDIQEYPEDW